MMAERARRYFTPEEYLMIEHQAEYKSEYIDGEIYAMAGASPAHIRITGNLFGELYRELLEGPCNPYHSDQRVRVSGVLYTYPDITVVCGDPRYVGPKMDNLVNPTLIIEVLSPSTESYDRGGKFKQYQGLSSLKQYVLVAQDRPHVECYTRPARGKWPPVTIEGLGGIVTLDSIGCELSMAAIYRGVALPLL
jgi:Uma2 family endonuclease